MNRMNDIKRVVAVIAAGRRAMTVASARWNRDPRSGFRAHIRAEALANAAWRRSNIVVQRHVPRTAMN